MKTILFRTLPILCAAVAGFSQVQLTISSLSPSSATAGGPGFTLTVNGTGFSDVCQVTWNRQPLSTTVASSTLMTTQVTASLVAQSGTASVQVRCGTLLSNPVSYAINPAPSLSGISPSSATAGGSGFTLTVTGATFMPGYVVTWNQSALQTTLLNSTQLTAAVPSTLIAKPGTASIQVTTPSGFATSPTTFTINAPSAPLTITSLSPNSSAAGGPGFTLTVNGGGFIQGATVVWNTARLQTAFVSSTQLTAQVPASLIASQGTATVTVTNPDGTVSNTAIFSIVLSLSIIDLNPSSATAGGPAFTLRVDGSGFAPSAVVQWNNSPLQTTFVSANQVTAAVPASLIASPGSATVVVINFPGTSGSATSNPATFMIVPQSLSISSLSPNSATAGGPDFTLTVNGSAFVQGVVVRWNNFQLVTTFVSATQLTAVVPASLIASPGSASVVVVNVPGGPGGSVSNAATFTIGASGLSISSLNPSSAAAGGGAFNLTVNGNGFVSGATVQWNGANLVTSFVSATQLTAAVPAGLIAAPGSASITVVNPGNAVSNAVSFSIGAPTPTITSLSPTTAVAGGAGFVLTVNGSGFMSGATIQWNGSALPTTFVSATQLTAAVPASLIATAGTASIAVMNPGGATSGTVALQIAPLMQPTLTVAGGPLYFLYRQEDKTAPPPQSISVFSTGAATPFTAAFASTSGNWLTLSPTSGQTAGSVLASVNAGSLAPGTYNGQITITAQNTNPPTVTVPVTLTVVGAQPPALNVFPHTLSLTAIQGSAPVTRQILISNTGGGTLNFTLQRRNRAGERWLSLDTTSGSATYNNPAAVTVTIDASALAPGIYGAEIVVQASNPDQSQTVTVVLAVSPTGPSIGVTQAGLEFIATTQGAAGPPQTFGIQNLGQGSMSWSIETRTLSGGSWLSASPAGGTAAAGADATSVSVSVNPAGLAAGRYHGSVRVRAPGAGNSPRLVSVVLNVLGSGVGYGPALSQYGAIFAGQAGGANPGPQDILLYNVSGRPLNFTVTRITDDAGGWLSVTPASGTLSTDSPGRLTLQANLAGMAAGVRRGTVRVAFDDGSTRAIGVAAVWAASGSPSAKDNREAAGCSPKALVPQFLTLAPGFAVTGGVPVNLAVQVVDDCGTPITSGATVLQISNDSRPVSLAHAGNGRWAGTWVPVDADAQVRIVAVAVTTQGTSRFGGETPILNGSVRHDSGTPAARPAGVFNSASYQAGDQIALGGWVSIFGDHLAASEAGSFNPPFGTELNGTQVLLADAPLRVQYVSPSQVNALIPSGLTPDTQQQLLIQSGNTLSVPVDVTVADNQPGIFTQNQQGTGQGAILIAGTADLASPGRPARRGEFISIFCTGLGAVTNDPGDGNAAPGGPLSETLQPVTVTIGGMQAPVSFAGLAPGFVGLYQVNAQVPESAPAGASVPVVLFEGNATSNPATIAVQ